MAIIVCSRLKRAIAIKAFMIHMPLGVGQVWHDPKFNWSYESEPEPVLTTVGYFIAKVRCWAVLRRST